MMKKNIEIIPEPGFIRVVVIGSVHSSPILEFFTLVVDAARNADVSKILFDIRSVQGQLTTMERYNYGSLIADQFRGLKVAIVVNQPLRDPNLFGETVAVNRGGNIRVFATLTEAYEWLKVKPANKVAGEDGK